MAARCCHFHSFIVNPLQVSAWVSLNTLQDLSFALYLTTFLFMAIIAMADRKLDIREIIAIKNIIGILHRPTRGEADCYIGQRDLTLSAINPIRDS